MNFDLVLPIALFAFVLLVIFLNNGLEKKIQSLFGGETKLSRRDVIILIATMGTMITVIALLPNLAIQILYLSVFSYSLFSFAYLASKKWYLSVLPPALFVASYFLFWNLLTFNIFAFTLACIMTIYMASLFSWKTTLIFAGLLTALDVVQVFFTGLMGQLAEKAVFQLSLPVVIWLPTYPSTGQIILGLGDIFLSGLLSIQSFKSKGMRAGIISSVTIGFAFFLFEIVIRNTTYFTYFPATIVVLAGWLLGMGIVRIAKRN